MKILFQTKYLDSGLFMTLASLAPYLLIFLVLYLMMIRPQIKQQKALTNMLENLKKGDNVITKGGVVGKIVNIASIASRQGGPSIPHYNASKAGVVSWTQSHALQLAPYQINVNAICPGLLWTPLFEHLIGRPDFLDNQALEGLTGRQRFEKIIELGTPMQKEQTPEDIGKLAAFLASDDAHNITGQAINVDGGRRMN